LANLPVTAPAAAPTPVTAISGGAKRLKVMTIVPIIVTPVVLLYQGWTYYVFRARVTGEEVRSATGVIAEHKVLSP